MHESRETLLKNKEWKRLLELSNYFYKNYCLCLKLSHEQKLDKIYCEWLLNEHDEYKNDFIKAFDFHNNTHNDLK
jgi:hypothetical protein